MDRVAIKPHNIMAYTREAGASSPCSCMDGMAAHTTTGVDSGDAGPAAALSCRHTPRSEAVRGPWCHDLPPTLGRVWVDGGVGVNEVVGSVYAPLSIYTPRTPLYQIFPKNTLPKFSPPQFFLGKTGPNWSKSGRFSPKRYGNYADWSLGVEKCGY